MDWSRHILRAAVAMALLLAAPAGARDAGGGQSPPRTQAGDSDDANTCLTCHASLPEAKLRQPATEYATSVHSDERIGCVGCHQGDARDATVQAHDWKGGFVPRPAHASIAKICGGCHANATFIRQFNARIRTDEAELLPLSLHGKLAQTGDTNAPTCTTCHGVHAIAPVGSLRSPANTKNVVRLCASCHEQRELMARYGIASNQVSRWERSAHARALDAGNVRAPSCVGCHGPHSATPPKASTVGRVCGQCHEEQLQAFRQSPHAKAWKRLGLSECVPCHDPHEATRPSWIVESAESACNRCHTEGERPRKVARELSSMVKAARDRMRAAEAKLEKNETAQRPSPAARAMLDDIRRQEQRLAVIVHSLDPARLDTPLRALLAAVERAEQRMADAERQNALRRRGYVVALGLALALFGLLVAKAVELARQRRRGGT
jgi:predicted CXXCH cytochrome family protein